MSNLNRFAAVSTKALAMEGQLLNDEDYINLLSRDNVSGIASYLKNNTHFASVLHGIDGGSIHRSQLEVLLKRSHVGGISKMVHYFSDSYKAFYKTMFIRYEIEDLKTIAKGIKAGNDNMAIKDSLAFLGYFSSFNMTGLLSSKSLLDFITNLKGTIYYNYLRPIEENRKYTGFFNIEMTLDLAFFDIFYKNLSRIDKNNISIIKSYLDAYVDLLNIQWIYRGLKFYGLPRELLFNYTISHGRIFDSDYIKRLCYSRSLEEFREIVRNTKYSFLFHMESQEGIFMERRILRYLYYNLKRIKVKSGMNMSQPLVYILLSEIEIRDIISVIESIRYGMQIDEAKKYLIRKL